MMFYLAIAAIVAVANAELSSDSIMGRNLLSHARRLDQAAAEEFSDAWVSGYSIKFQGCHNIKQWNSAAEGEDDVKIATTSLVRFRLCPTDACSASKAAGCSTSYGDYVIDMDNFLGSYYEAFRQNTEYNCQMYLQSNCNNCEDDGNQGDDWTAEKCEYDCYNGASMSQCIDRNPYEEDNGEQQQQFEVQNYMACAEFKAQRRREDRDLAEDEVKYYVGPYCGSQGGAIYMGLFTDDTCTTAASGITFQEIAGYALPYSEASVVDASCLSCIEPADVNEQNANDQADADAVSESCETLYFTAGKCEQSLPVETVPSPNNAGCNYMEGIKIVRQDGIITSASSRPSAVATSFIVISAMAFFAMAFYVWYLRTRLGVKKNTLL
jgi:hypothetical protein